MADASQWRSSEYSERAEELFAEYVRARRAGEAPSFEAFCAQHPELEDELSGLLTDWENVGGVVERLIAEPTPKARRPQAPPPPPPPPSVEVNVAAIPTPVAVPAATVAPVPAAMPARVPPPDPAPARPSYGLIATFVLLVSAVGTFAFLEWRGGQALAAERDEIARLQAQTAELAERAVQRSSELSEENQALETRAEQSEREREEARREREAADAAREAAEARARAADEATARMAARVELTELTAAVAALTPEEPEAQAAIATLRARAAALAPQLADTEVALRLDELEVALASVEAAVLERERELAAWADVAAAVAAHWDYAGLELAPQDGLAPLGPDPASGRFEFAHLATGSVPLRTEDGALELTDETGLVLVLVPPSAEEPAFFLARAPLDAAHWTRAGEPTTWNPERASAAELTLALARIGLVPASPRQLAAAGVARTPGAPPLAARALAP